jgi:hypothetical protein
MRICIVNENPFHMAFYQTSKSQQIKTVNHPAPMRTSTTIEHYFLQAFNILFLQFGHHRQYFVPGK